MRLNAANHAGAFYISGPVYALQEFCDRAGVPREYIQRKETRDVRGELAARGYIRLRGRLKAKAKLTLREGFRYDGI